MPVVSYRSAWKTVQQNGGGWLYTLVVISSLVLFTLLTFGRFNDTVGRWLIQIFGRGNLWIVGVDLEVEGLDDFSQEIARIVTFNHSSTLDLFTMTAIYPVSGVGILKKEMLRLPVIGWAVRLLDFIALDRGDKERAAASLRSVAERIQRDKLTVLIAPEGTRAAGFELGRFKLGAFRLARATGAPITPLVIHGGHRLPEMFVGDCSDEELPQFADALRAMYAEELAGDEPEATATLDGG
jgi:1-acyl-sn-glycerol-3-phosphate acyltransferase